MAEDISVNPGSETALFPALALELFYVLGRIFLRGKNSPQDGQEKNDRADLKSILDRQRNAARRRPLYARPAKEVWKNARQCCAEADKEALHDKARRALFRSELVGDEGAERLHADVDARVQNPEQPGSHPQRRGVRHDKERDARKDCADEKVGPPPSQRPPRSVAHRADDGLDD